MKIAKVKKVDAVLDFRSSGQGLCPVEQLFMGEVCIANALHLSWWDDDPIQVMVCEHCGHVRCEPGGWITFRRTGDFVLFLPAFTMMLDDGTDEYAPPDYMARYGVPVFDRPNYSKLREFVPVLPEIGQIRPLVAWETIRLLQWEAPGNILGRFPEPARLKRDQLVAVSEGDLHTGVAGLNGLLQTHADSSAGARLRPVRRDETPLTFYLDRSGYLAWRALTSSEEGFAIFFEPGMVVEFSTGEEHGV